MFNQAVNDVSFFINPGETFGLVGESGCGKSTLGRCIANLYKPDEGSVLFDGKDLQSMNKSEKQIYRQSVQMIFQDPMESLNPRHSISEIIEEPLIIHKAGSIIERKKRILELLNVVGLPANSQSRYPFELSGGQRQRVGIARALALNPALIICDEAVSALDVSIQAQIINLLLDLQDEFKLSYLFIAHDMAVVKQVSHRIGVMYLGKLAEVALADSIYQQPKHPYTQSLIQSIPSPDPHQPLSSEPLKGEVPSAINPPEGCYFHTRCPKVLPQCRTHQPKLTDQRQHQVSCHLY